jgi:hypothetical protein
VLHRRVDHTVTVSEYRDRIFAIVPTGIRAILVPVCECQLVKVFFCVLERIPNLLMDKWPLDTVELLVMAGGLLGLLAIAVCIVCACRFKKRKSYVFFCNPITVINVQVEKEGEYGR